jgi:DNA-binding transcriptional MerR regulator
MRIGELAARVGTTTRALRFYETRGLLGARRAANGYRDYREDDVRLLHEIAALQELGFSLDETRPFVDCLRAGHATGDRCADSIAVYQRKLAEVDRCLQRLNELRTTLETKLAEATQRRWAHPCMINQTEDKP